MTTKSRSWGGNTAFISVLPPRQKIDLGTTKCFPITNCAHKTSFFCYWDGEIFSLLAEERWTKEATMKSQLSCQCALLPAG